LVPSALALAREIFIADAADLRPSGPVRLHQQRKHIGYNRRLTATAWWSWRSTDLRWSSASL